MHREIEETEDLWHVEVSPGDVKLVTLEQLDEAFNAGLVNEDTRVWQEGMDTPARLGELLGGGDDESPEAEPTATHEAAWESSNEAQLQPYQYDAPPTQPAPPSYASYAAGTEPMPGSMRYQKAPEDTLVGISAAQVAPRTVYGGERASVYPPAVESRAPALHVAPNPAPAYGAYGAPPARVPARAAYAAPPASPPSYGGYPPVVAAPSPAASSWPPVIAAGASGAVSAPPPSTVAPSVVPLAFDLDDDVMIRRSGKGKGLVVGAALLAAAAGVAFAVNTMNAQGATGSPAVAAQAPAPAPEPPKSHRLDVGDAPVHLKEVPEAAPITTRATEAVTENDKNAVAALSGKAVTPAKPAKGAPARRVAPAAKGRASRSAGAGAKVGSSGGSKYDPLNGAL